VRQIVQLDDAVAVVADHMGAAKKGLAALIIQWDKGPNATLNTEDIARDLGNGTLKPGAVAQNVGDVTRAITGLLPRSTRSTRCRFLPTRRWSP